MIFQNIELFNVNELIADGGEYKLSRLPVAVLDTLPEQYRLAPTSCTGTELRFVMNSDEVKIKLRMAAGTGNVIAYFGDFQSDWPYSTFPITSEVTEFTFKKSGNMALMKKLYAEHGGRYDPEVVRLLLPQGQLRFISVEGDVTPPDASRLPAKTLLSYGSSITHGSLAVGIQDSYAAVCGARLGLDVRNLGLAGACRVEKEVTDFIAGRGDWDILTAELGINILGMENDEFERRVNYFVTTVHAQNPDKPLFITDVFLCHADLNGSQKPSDFRKIVREAVVRLNSPLVHHIPALDLLGTTHDPAGGRPLLGSGLVHPSCDGQRHIGEELARRIRDAGDTRLS